MTDDQSNGNGGAYTRRELDRLTAAVEALNATITRFEERMAETYVRKDVYLEARKADGEASLAMQEDIKKVSSVIDWAVKIVVGAVIVGLVGLLIASNGGTP